MKKTLIITLAFVILVFAVATMSIAEVIYTKDGRMIEAEIDEAEDGTIWYMTTSGEVEEYVVQGVVVAQLDIHIHLVRSGGQIARWINLDQGVDAFYSGGKGIVAVKISGGQGVMTGLIGDGHDVVIQPHSHPRDTSPGPSVSGNSSGSVISGTSLDGLAPSGQVQKQL